MTTLFIILAIIGIIYLMGKDQKFADALWKIVGWCFVIGMCGIAFLCYKGNQSAEAYDQAQELTRQRKQENYLAYKASTQYVIDSLRHVQWEKDVQNISEGDFWIQEYIEQVNPFNFVIYEITYLAGTHLRVHLWHCGIDANGLAFADGGYLGNSYSWQETTVYEFTKSKHQLNPGIANFPSQNMAHFLAGQIVYKSHKAK